MCIMYIKEFDQAFPSDTTMKICWDDNRDGAGYSWYNGDTEMWHTVKGLMTWEAFLERFNKDRKEYNLDHKSVIVHFRVGTSGPEIGGATHPFPATTVVGVTVNTLEFVSKGVFFHNGTIGHGRNGLSDTQVATTELVQPMVRHIFENDEVDEKLLDILADVLKADVNRYVITHGPNIRYLGNWVKDKESGLIYSNNRYKEDNTRYEAARLKTQKHGEYLALLRADNVTDKDMLSYDMHERLADVTRFLDDDGHFKWSAWDDRYNTDLPKTTTTTDVTVYDADGNVKYSIDQDKDDIEAWDANTTQISLTTCLTCNLASYPGELEQGECPGCGTILDPSLGRTQAKELYDNERSYDCPQCDSCMAIELTGFEVTKASYKAKGLDDFCQCWKCDAVWGYTKEDSAWVIGTIQKDTQGVKYILELTEGHQANG